MTGTLANTAAIVAGSLIGAAIHSRMPRKTVDIVFQAIGLFTLIVGISMALSSGDMLLALVSVVAGAVVGQWLRIDERLRRLPVFIRNISPGSRVDGWTERGQNRSAAKGSEGFITASMLFCIGSMSIIGAIEDGTGQFPTLLYTKSIMDGVSSLVLASSFGIAVLFSAVPVLLYQGSLTLIARYASAFMDEGMISDLTSVGGILLVGLALNILKIRDINVVNMLPSLVIILLLASFRG